MYHIYSFNFFIPDMRSGRPSSMSSTTPSSGTTTSGTGLSSMWLTPPSSGTGLRPCNISRWSSSRSRCWATISSCSMSKKLTNYYQLLYYYIIIISHKKIYRTNTKCQKPKQYFLKKNLPRGGRTSTWGWLWPPPSKRALGPSQAWRPWCSSSEEEFGIHGLGMNTLFLFLPLGMMKFCSLISCDFFRLAADGAVLVSCPLIPQPCMDGWLLLNYIIQSDVWMSVCPA